MIATKSNKYYECTSCGQKSFKWLGQCPNSSCKKWNTMEERLEQKKNYSIPKVSAKRKEEMKNEPIDTKQEDWFLEVREKLTGVCQFCGGKTEKGNDETFKRSIAHLLPKRKTQFPSVATHPDNWLELCFYGNSCHTNFDNGIIEWEYLEQQPVWKIILEKYRRIYPDIREREKKNLPMILIQNTYPNSISDVEK